MDESPEGTIERYIDTLGITDGELESLVIEQKVREALELARQGHRAMVAYLLICLGGASGVVDAIRTIYDLRVWRRWN